MMDCAAQKALVQRLAQDLGPEVGTWVIARAAGPAGEPAAVSRVLALVDQLERISAKVARAAVEALPELDRCAGLAQIVPWLHAGIALAESSAATALRYFKQSPAILGRLEPAEARATVLAIVVESADREPTAALEYLRTSPDILAVVPLNEVRRWLDIGIELVAVDVVVGLEYIRQISHVASVLQVDEVQRWLSFGMQLMAPNTLGKPDYLAVIEFLRTSPAMLGQIEHPGARSKVVAVGALLAEHSPELGVTWLAEAPALLRSIPSPERQVTLLDYGVLVAKQDAEAALWYLRRCSEIMGLMGEGPQALSRFDAWFNAGMEVLAYSREGGRAYFGVESRKALASVEQAMSGVPLRLIARRIKFFVEGLCGTDVAVAALPESSKDHEVRATVSADGRTIALPSVLRRYATAEENERGYLVMAAHEAGHLEFGTYRLRLESVADVIEEARRRYAHSEPAGPQTLAEVFQLYPLPALARDLWTVLEDARIEFLLQEEYPGLRHDLARLASEAVAPRDLAKRLTIKELMVDGLLRLSTGESLDSAVPHALKEEVSTLWTLCQPLFRPEATAEDAVRLAHDLYVAIETLAQSRGEPDETDSATENSEQKNQAGAAAEQPTDMYRPMINPAYRGAMNPEFITWDRRVAERSGRQDMESNRKVGAAGESTERSVVGMNGGSSNRESGEGGERDQGRSVPALAGELLALDVEQRSMARSNARDERAVYYPEWDHAIQDYRINWCRVIERRPDRGGDDFVDTIIASHRGSVRLLRKLFESMRSPSFRRVAGEAEGDDPDMDAVVQRAAELRAGLEGSERVYVRREKRERDVAAAFLVDVSGSTSRRLDSGRRVIEIEKESLVLLCEALEAIGDEYALYAYSGQGRSSVEFFTIKDFDDRLGAGTACHLGGLSPQQQNRDGAAIRHASAKLLEREAKNRVLVLLSDGRPLDGDYKDEYAFEDTKAALREARRQGIRPFCVTVDREAQGYLHRMYGDVQFVVIDRAESLPSRLPAIYRRLTAVRV